MRLRHVTSRAGPVLAMAATLALSAAPAPLRAADAVQAGSPIERSVKAAFLYKFLGYSEFPAASFAGAGAPVTIGVLNADELAAELGRITAGRNVNKRPVAVRALRESEPLAGVHMLFIGGADGARVARVLKGVQPPLLSVSEAEQGLQQGSIINFKIVDERVRFDVSLEAAERNNVRLSSRLLSVAHQVHKELP